MGSLESTCWKQGYEDQQISGDYCPPHSALPSRPDFAWFIQADEFGAWPQLQQTHYQGSLTVYSFILRHLSWGELERLRSLGWSRVAGASGEIRPGHRCGLGRQQQESASHFSWSGPTLALEKPSL